MSDMPEDAKGMVVAEWVLLAETDRDLAFREAGYQRPHLGQVAFLYQQSTEKLMKALLIQRGVTPPYTHDLCSLDLLLSQAGLDPVATVPDLLRLGSAAVQSRYPGHCYSPMEIAQLADIANKIWARLRPLV